MLLGKFTQDQGIVECSERGVAKRANPPVSGLGQRSNGPANNNIADLGHATNERYVS